MMNCDSAQTESEMIRLNRIEEIVEHVTATDECPGVEVAAEVAVEAVAEAKTEAPVHNMDVRSAIFGTIIAAIVDIFIEIDPSHRITDTTNAIGRVPKVNRRVRNVPRPITKI